MGNYLIQPKDDWRDWQQVAERAGVGFTTLHRALGEKLIKHSPPATRERRILEEMMLCSPGHVNRHGCGFRNPKEGEVEYAHPLHALEWLAGMRHHFDQGTSLSSNIYAFLIVNCRLSLVKDATPADLKYYFRLIRPPGVVRWMNGDAESAASQMEGQVLDSGDSEYADTRYRWYGQFLPISGRTKHLYDPGYTERANWLHLLANTRVDAEYGEGKWIQPVGKSTLTHYPHRTNESGAYV